MAPGTEGSMKIVVCLLVPFLVQVVFIYGVDQTEKPGKCPPFGDLTLGVCFPMCNYDSQCEKNQKCCKTGCDGYQCLAPVEMPRSCPPVAPVNGTTCVKTTECTSDSNCNDNQKCCPSACNSTVCQIPE